MRFKVIRKSGTEQFINDALLYKVEQLVNDGRVSHDEDGSTYYDLDGVRIDDRQQAELSNLFWFISQPEPQMMWQVLTHLCCVQAVDEKPVFKVSIELDYSADNPEEVYDRLQQALTGIGAVSVKDLTIER